MTHRIGILTTLWQRPHIERVVLSYYADLDLDGIELVPLAVGSEGEASRTLALDCGWEYVEAPNSPLGAKHNAGMEALRESDVHGVVIIGSDDLLSRSYFEALRHCLDQGADTFHVRGCFFYEVATGRMSYGAHWHPGAGRYVSAAAMDAFGWRPWPDERDRLLDGGMNEAMRFGKAMWDGDAQKSGVVVLDVKTDTNLWDFDACAERGGGTVPVINQGAIWEQFPGVRDQIHQPHHIDNG